MPVSQERLLSQNVLIANLEAQVQRQQESIKILTMQLEKRSTNRTVDLLEDVEKLEQKLLKHKVAKLERKIDVMCSSEQRIPTPQSLPYQVPPASIPAPMWPHAPVWIPPPTWFPPPPAPLLPPSTFYHPGMHQPPMAHLYHHHPAMHQSPAAHMFYNSRPNPYTNDYLHQRRTAHQPRSTQLDQGVHTGQTVVTSGSRQHSNAQPQQPPQEHPPQTNCQSTEPILGCRDHMKDSPVAAEQTCAGLTVNLSTSPCAPDSPTPSVPAPVSPILDPSIPVSITSYARMPASPTSNIEVNDSPAARSRGKQRYIEYQELLVKLPPIKCNKNDDLLVDLSSAPRISSSPADLPFLEGTVNLNLAL